MRTATVVFLIALAIPGLLLFPCPGRAQDSPSNATLAVSMGINVFPKSGQDPLRQSQDEAECYDLAKREVGADPFQLTEQLAEQEEETEEAVAEARQAGRGSGLRGAARGAARGAVVGEIVDDDASEGAAYGAAAGALRGRRSARRTTRQDTQQAEEQGQARQEATQEQIDNFKKVFGACLEGREYTVTIEAP
jgi:hypothetical protein